MNKGSAPLCLLEIKGVLKLKKKTLRYLSYRPKDQIRNFASMQPCTLAPTRDPKTLMLSKYYHFCSFNDCV